MPRLLRDWTDSEKVNTLSFQGEVLFTRLIMKADDYGIYFANPKLLKSNLFPFKTDTIRDTDITRWLTECEKAGLIVIYEVQSKPYLQIREFNQRLRSLKPKYPPPPKHVGHMSYTCQTNDGLNRIEVEVEDEVEFINNNAQKNVFVSLMGKQILKTAFELLQEKKMYWLEQRIMKGDAACFRVEEIKTAFNEKYNFYNFNDENHLSNCMDSMIKKMFDDKHKKLNQVSSLKDNSKSKKIFNINQELKDEL